MIVVVWILLSTVPGRLCSDLRDKRLLLNDQTVVHETIQQLQVEVQQLKTEVIQLKQSQSGLSVFIELNLNARFCKFKWKDEIHEK